MDTLPQEPHPAQIAEQEFLPFDYQPFVDADKAATDTAARQVEADYENIPHLREVRDALIARNETFAAATQALINATDSRTKYGGPEVANEIVTSLLTRMIVEHNADLEAANNTPTAIKDEVAKNFAEMGLGDQTLFGVQVENAVAEMPEQVAVAMIDGDDLRMLNKRKGREAGNAYLRKLGKVVKDSARKDIRIITPDEDHSLENAIEIPGDNVNFLEKSANHLTGDEFAVVLRGVKSQSDIDVWLTRLKKGLADENIKASVGVAIHTKGQSGADLIEKADLLMQVEKTRHKLDALSPSSIRTIRRFGRKLLKNGVNVSHLPTLIDELVGKDLEEANLRREERTSYIGRVLTRSRRKVA